MTNAGIKNVHTTRVLDEHGECLDIAITGERALTIYLNNREIVTLMTMGTHPELLTLGYLKNQGLVARSADIIAIQVEWDVAAVAVTTSTSPHNIDEILAERIVTSGCGQGTMFASVIASLDKLSIDCPLFTADTVYQVLHGLAKYNKVYKRAGAVHGCALCTADGTVEFFVEDVGRHNAVDAISGWMWLEGITGSNKIFYTTGRLTSEMVIKVAQMSVPLLLSRSGVTEMGLNIAEKIGIGMVARAKGRHFLVYSGLDRFKYS